MKTRKTYIKPSLFEVIPDREINVMMDSGSPNPGGDEGDWEDADWTPQSLGKSAVPSVSSMSNRKTLAEPFSSDSPF